MSTPHNRKRAYSSKVRSGCTSCKKRHIKCDEAKPICKSCRSRNLECWYAFRKTCVLNPRLSSKDVSFDAESCPATLYQNPSQQWGSPSEQQAFQFFLLKAAPWLANHGLVGARPFWLSFVPRAASVLPAVRSLLIAISLLECPVGSSDTCALRARAQAVLLHYNRAIHVLTLPDIHPADARVAPLIAGVLETLSFNGKRANMHMDAVKAHIGGISGTTGGVTKTSDHDQSMQRVFYDLKGFSCTRAKLPTSSLDIADSIYQGIAMRNAELLPLTGVNARKRSWSAADVCAAYREYFLLFDPTDAQEETVAAAIAFIMQGTIKMLPTRYTGQSSVLWSAQQLLCDVALSLLPKEIEPDVVTGIPKEKVLTCALEYIVGQCGLLLDTKSLRRADKRVLHETLGVTLNAVIRFANVRKVVEKARILLMHVEKGEPLLERS